MHECRPVAVPRDRCTADKQPLWRHAPIDLILHATARSKGRRGKVGDKGPRKCVSAHGCLLCLHRALHTPCRLRVVGAVGAVGADELIELSEREQRARARARERGSERASERDFIRKPCPADWDCSQLITYLLHTPAVPSAAAGPRYLSLTRETEWHSVCCLINSLPFSLFSFSLSLCLFSVSLLSLSLFSVCHCL